MTDETRELLLECKKAGYERVALFVEDKRVPESTRIYKSPGRDRIGNGSPQFPFCVVSCYPAGVRLNGKDIPGCTVSQFTDPPYSCPAIKAIVKKLQLNPGGGVSGDTYNIASSLVPNFDAGYYDLSELN